MVCVTGRGAAPPEHCGGLRGYRLMLRRQAAGSQLSDPELFAAPVQRVSNIYLEDSRNAARRCETFRPIFTRRASTLSIGSISPCG